MQGYKEGKKKIEKENLIVVEGKTDRIIIEAILDSIDASFKERVQVFELGGKDNLENFKNLIKSSDIQVKCVLLILDKDENFNSTKQKAENFRNNLSQQFPYIDYLIIPPEDIEGKELEDYIVEILLQNDSKISYLKNCIEKYIKKSLTPEKLGKKIFYTYLLLNDDCNYQGTSFSADQIKRCIDNIIDKMDYIKEKIEEFFTECL